MNTVRGHWQLGTGPVLAAQVPSIGGGNHSVQIFPSPKGPDYYWVARSDFPEADLSPQLMSYTDIIQKQIAPKMAMDAIRSEVLAINARIRLLTGGRPISHEVKPSEVPKEQLQ